jgi:hypothetical protein
MTPDQQRRAERGRRAHEQYYREGLAAAGEVNANERCFVASCLFGAGAWQTIELRRYRDELLLHGRLGRLLVVAYYRIASLVRRILARLPWLQPLVRAAVDAVARATRRPEGGAKWPSKAGSSGWQWPG